MIALVPDVGEHAAAVVLSQIMDWHQSDRTAQFDGEYWIAKSRAEVCRGTHMTLDQYKRIMPLLKRQGWIESVRHLYRDKVTPYLRLTDKGQQAFLRLVSSDVTRLVAYDTKLIDLLNTDRSTLIHTLSKKEESTICIGESRFAEERERTIREKDGRRDGRENRESKGTGEEDDQSRSEGKGQGEELQSPAPSDNKPVFYSMLKTGKFMKAAEILKAMENPTPGNLGTFWKSRMKLVAGDDSYHSISLKEYGQLKQLQKKLGDQTKPVIDYAINYWWKFASEASYSANLQGFPPDPHIGFLLKYHAVAVNLLIHQSATPKKQEPKAVVQLVAPPLPPEEQPYVMTPEEFTVLMEGLKSP